MGVELINQVINWDVKAAIAAGKSIGRPVTPSVVKPVALALANRCNQTTRTCHPSEVLLARDIGFSERSIERGVKWLFVNEYIDIERVHRMGRYRFNRYTLLYRFKDHILPPIQRPPDRGSDCISPPDRGSLTNRPRGGLNRRETAIPLNEEKNKIPIAAVQDTIQQDTIEQDCPF